MKRTPARIKRYQDTAVPMLLEDGLQLARPSAKQWKESLVENYYAQPFADLRRFLVVAKARKPGGAERWMVSYCDTKAALRTLLIVWRGLRDLKVYDLELGQRLTPVYHETVRLIPQD